jgi:hypothetical protein
MSTIPRPAGHGAFLLRTRWTDHLGRAGASLLSLELPIWLDEVLQRNEHRLVEALRPFDYQPHGRVLQASARARSGPAARRQTRLAAFALELLGHHSVPLTAVDQALREQPLVPGASWAFSQVRYRARKETPLPVGAPQ